MENISFDQLKLVIFDVDGTLYYQKHLRRRMLLAILNYYSIRPWRIKEILVLYHFRKEREKHTAAHGSDLAEEQYQWCVPKTGLSVKEIKRIVEKWMGDYPNQFLKKYMYPGVASFFEELQKRGILTAVYSDYPADKKLLAMNLKTDLTVCSTDTTISALKPAPNGINYILKQLAIQQKETCLFIGDRDELDGVCARRAGIPFLLLDHQIAKVNFYKILSDKLSST